MIPAYAVMLAACAILAVLAIFATLSASAIGSKLATYIALLAAILCFVAAVLAGDSIRTEMAKDEPTEAAQ